MSEFRSNADWAIYLALLDIVYLHFQAIFKKCLVRKNINCYVTFEYLDWNDDN